MHNFDTSLVDTVYVVKIMLTVLQQVTSTDLSLLGLVNSLLIKLNTNYE